MSGIVVVQRCGRLPLRPSRKISQAALCHFRSVFTLNLTHKNTDETLWRLLILTCETFKPKIKHSASGMSNNNRVVLCNKHR